MIIRNITKEDVTTFWNLRLRALEEFPEAFSSSYEESSSNSIEQVASRISEEEDNYILGAFSDDTLVGMVGFIRENKKKLIHKSFIWGMYVVPEEQGKRIGRKLLEELIHRAKQLEGLSQVNLVVVSSNEAAKKLYQSLGFEIYGLERNAMKVEDTYYDEDLMVLILSNQLD